VILPLDSKLGPEVGRKLWDRLLKDKELQDVEWGICWQSPWYFIVNYCWTIRREEEKSFVERVPPKEYLRLIANDWYTHKSYLLSKSRQLMATWLMVILHLRECMFEKHISVVCQTKKEDDADSEMIQRAKFVWDNLPSWMKRRCPAKYSFCKMLFSRTGSRLYGIPSGGDKIRSRNPNYLLSDEFAFQGEAEESYTAALACCHRITLVSSANPGFMRDLVKDRIRPGL
jgi:hypothetical protein